MTGSGLETRRPRRWALVALAVIGVALIVLPFAFGMFTRAPKGADMIAGFRPYMTAARLDGYQRDMRQIDAGVRDATTTAAAVLVPASGHRSASFATRFPDVVAFGSEWPPIDKSMTSMLTTIQANLGNYDDVAALPNFSLFPWFFVIPGVLALILVSIAVIRPRWWRPARWALVALGIGLILAPVAFRMFERAPAGEHMVNAFRTIETQSNVESVQDDFGTIASGQGAIQLELVPVLQGAGLSGAQIRTRFPGITELDDSWVGILNDLTPMIGAMSDNIANYQAVAALPPFRLFPWFFVLPGLLIAGLAVAAGPRRRTGRAASIATHNSPVSEGGP